MGELYLYSREFLNQMMRKVLGTIDRTMLSTGASE
jgi:hypothetical protein